MDRYSYALKGALTVCVIYMAAAMIAAPTACIGAAAGALKICGDIVIPSLFPFIFCGNLFVSLGAARIMSRGLSGIMRPVFGVSGAGALALVLGIVSGYPVGASCAASLYSSGECSKNEAERLLAFCNNSGPMFIIGAVGAGMLGNHRLGVLLYMTHIFAALITGILFKNYGKVTSTHTLPPSRDEADIKTAAPDIGAAISRSVDTMLSICGFIIIFAVFTAALPDCEWRKYIYPLLEITGGIRQLLPINASTLPITAMFIALSGVSVLAQVAAITMPAGLSLRPYILGKLTHAAIAFVLTYAAVRLTPQSEAAFALTYPILTVPTPRQLFGEAIITIAFSALAIGLLILIAKICERHEK